MSKKKMKTLVATMACATLLVGGLTVYAANNPDLCTHDGYYIVEDSGGHYTDEGDIHIYHYWEEILCMECFGYDIRTENFTLPHDYDNGVCIYCGHSNIAN